MPYKDPAVRRECYRLAGIRWRARNRAVVAEHGRRRYADPVQRKLKHEADRLWHSAHRESVKLKMRDWWLKMKNNKLDNFLHRSVFALLLFFFHIVPAHASGGISITEIMYDPAGTDTNREWIEIYNGSSLSIDITGYSLLTDGVPSTHHGLSGQSGNSIGAEAYAVIVQNVDAFKADYPNFTGNIFDSSWSGLTASAGKTLAILNGDSATLDQVTYDPSIGGTNDGNSLQKNSGGIWIAASPSPGSATTATTSSSPASSGENTSTNSSGSTADASGTPTEQNVDATPHMQAAFSVPKNAIVGIAVPVSARVYGYEGEYRSGGVFHYAFGDGSAYDSTVADSFEHVYAFPGSYVVSFEYRSYPYLPEPEIAARATVDVSSSSVAISSVTADGTVSLVNTGMKETDMSKWVVASMNGVQKTMFMIPSGTIVLPGHTMILPEKMTGLVFTSTPSVEVLLPSGIVSASYGGAQVVVASAPEKQVVAIPAVKEKAQVAIAERVVQAMPVQDLSGDSLEANAIGAIPDQHDSTPKEKSRSLVPYVVALLGIIVGAVIALKTLNVFPLKNASETGEDESESETKKIADTIRILEE